MLLEKIEALLKEVQELKASNADEIEALRVKYLSKKGEIASLMNDFRSVAADQKRAVGMKINELKQCATERINALREAVATSGNYERFVERDGKRLSHILDARTGEPVSGTAGVTVVAASALLADGLSTTLFILGPTNGLAFLKRHYPGTAALWLPEWRLPILTQCLLMHTSPIRAAVNPVSI